MNQLLEIPATSQPYPLFIN